MGGRTAGAQGGPPDLDLELLGGFSFGCRPDCGLCCFTEPAVSTSERSRLLQIEPSARFGTISPSFSVIHARPDGGACQFLAQRRCRVHAERPFVCRSFPIIVHLGVRAQASLVLSCPGVTLALEPVRSPARELGLDEELASVRQALAGEDLAEWRESWIVGVEALGLSEEDTALAGDPLPLQRRLAGNPPLPRTQELEDAGLPSVDSGWENLPGVFLEGHGVVALAERDDLWEAYVLSEGGQEPRCLGSFLPPEKMPRLGPDAEVRLRAYASYLARRDQTLGQLLAVPEGFEGMLEDALAAEIREAGAEVVLRAALLAQLAGRPSGTLDATDVDAGIRATDMDRLDRPTIGALL